VTIPGYTSTGSKRPEAMFHALEEHVPRMVRSSGARVWDQQGREYLDLSMALGAVALGYAHPRVVEAVTQAVRDGGVGGLSPVLEQEVAQRLAQALPGVEAVRFLKTGAEAVAAATRIARVATGRETVITCGYHGWLDWCADVQGVPGAIRALRSTIPFNDVPALQRALAETQPAAVIVEPVIDGLPDSAWLVALRDETIANGCLLVFDEIKTAFRLAVGGMAEVGGITPDLTVVGKALGNGLPIAAVGGSRAIMNAAEHTWISSTLATEWASLAAANAVLDVFRDEPVTQHLAERGQQLFDALVGLAREEPSRAEVHGVPQMCYLAFVDEADGGAVARRAASNGLLFKRTAYNFVSYAHSESDVTASVAILADALEATRSC